MANVAILNYCNLKCPYCVDKNTNILMADGTSKKIKDIVKGDMVIGFEEIVEKNKQRHIFPTAVSSDLMIHTELGYYKIKLVNGNELLITGNHPVLSTGMWRTVDNLILEDFLTELKEGYLIDVAISSIEYINEPLEVYNFETESHTYIANNIAVHNCFADDMIHKKHQAMSVEDYRKALEFLARTPRNHVGIIGGEPTLHPDFKEILKETNKYCKELDTSATLFTNGINLEPFLPYIGDRIGLLININSPQYQPAESYAKLIETLDHLDSLSWFDRKVSCGCNIHPGLEDYSFIWEIVDKYHLTHLRTSVVSPAAQYEKYRSDKEGYYNMMKPRFLQYCKDAIKHHCVVNIDCGHIPFCYFTSEEKDLVMEATQGACAQND